MQRQLQLFAESEAELLAELRAAEQTYDGADRDEAEAAYAEIQLVVDAGSERLAELRDAYAATLDEDAAAEYEGAFLHAAARRFPRFTALL